MHDDSFKLGNFSGLGDGNFDDLDHPAPPVTDIAPRAESGVIKHPTVKSEVQAKFRSRPDMELREIPLDKIIPNPFQPRRIFNEEKLKELADSIQANGIIQPMVVVEREDGRYEIIVGERRFRASKLAGLTVVPAFIKSEMPAQAKLEVALIENVQRADLNPIEEAKAYQRLVEEFGMSARDIGKRVGKHYSTVSNLTRLLNLPMEVQQALIEEKIAEGQARPLLTLRDQAEMLEMFKIVLARGMKVREIEARVREISRRKIKVRDMFTPDPFLSSLENLLRSKFGTRVEVNKGAKGGKITIEFYSDEELNSIVDKLT